nr:thermonuclease family protein [Anaerolineae bacterium]
PLTTARVVAVVNGDTIDVMIGNTRRRVKYMGLSAPIGTQCFAVGATNLNRQLVNGQTVTLEQVGINADAAGNLPRLVYLSNNKLVNEELLSRGAARVQSAALSDTLANQLTKAQQAAVTARAGLWAACGQTRP